MTKEFLDGRIPLFRKEYDLGDGHAARIAELKMARARLREDRSAGLYDHPDDTAWYRTEYSRMGAEIAALEQLPDRAAGMRWVMTGQTVADQWHAALDDAARREFLFEYRIRAVLFPAGHDPRVWVHGLDPDTETEARQQAAEQAQRENDAAGQTGRAVMTGVSAAGIDPDSQDWTGHVSSECTRIHRFEWFELVLAAAPPHAGRSIDGV